MVPRAGEGRGVRVAVDGVDAAGKTVFAGELAAALEERGRAVLCASVDGFHHPRAVRYRRGKDSPEGYFRDSYDYDRLVSELLAPLGPGGDGRVRTRVFDWRADRPVDEPARAVEPGTVLVLDGIFLHRDELRAYWDFSVYLDVDLDVSARRMAARDGITEAGRYVEGQRRYLAAAEPARRASVVVDNTVFDHPRMIRTAG